MATVTRYQRREGLDVVPAGPRLSGDALGNEGARALQRLGEGAGDLAARRGAQQVAFEQEKLGQQQRTEAAKRLAEFKNGRIAAFEKSKGAAAEGAPGFTPVILDEYDAAAQGLMDGITDEGARAYMDLGLTEFRGAVQSDALRFETGAVIDKKKADIDNAIDLARNLLATHRGTFEDELGSLVGVIDASGLPADEIRKKRDQASEGLSASAIAAGLQEDPVGTLKRLKAGKWNVFANADDVTRFIAAGEAEIERRRDEARRMAREAQDDRKVDFQIRYADFISSAEATGVAPTIDGKPGSAPLASANEARLLFPGPTGERMARKMETALEKGRINNKLQHTSFDEDEALKAQYAPKPGDVFTSDQAELANTLLSGIEAKRKAAAEQVKFDLDESAGEAQRHVAAHWADWVNDAFAKGVPEEAKTWIAEAYDGPAMQEKLALLDGQAELGKTSRDIAAGRLPENEELVADLAAAAGKGGPGSATAVDKLKIANDLVEAKRTAFQKDPASAAAQYSPLVRAQWQSVEQLQGDPRAAPGAAAAAARKAVALGVEEQLKNGVDPVDVRRLPQNALALGVRQIQEAPPAKVAEVVDGIVDLYGMDGLREIVAAGAPASVIPIAAAQDPSDQPWRSVLIKAGQENPADTARTAETRGVKASDIDAAIQALPEETKAALPAVYLDAVRTVALYQAAHGMNQAAALDFAMQPFAAHSFHANDYGGAYSVPPGFDDEKVTAGLQVIVAAVGERYALLPEETLGGNPIAGDPVYRAAEQARAIREGRYQWLGNRKGDGLVLAYETGDPVLLANGKPFEISFAQAQAVVPSVAGTPKSPARPAANLPELK